ncbi:tetraacyldisaccharide 4'-kinase [Helicobacter sp. T3_23-1056]
MQEKTTKNLSKKSNFTKSNAAKPNATKSNPINSNAKNPSTPNAHTTNKTHFLDSYFFNPNLPQKILAFLLLPCSFVYFCIASLKRKIQNIAKTDFGVPIISVGNLIAGGSGKTPFIIYLARFLSQKRYTQIYIISRGYGRQSRGLVWVAKDGEILESVLNAGDEPYLIAQNLSAQKISLIVCENRKKALQEAIKNGAKIILLDDGFRFGFCKFDIILRPKIEPYFRFCLPSGIYRESPKIYNQYQTPQSDNQPNNQPDKNERKTYKNGIFSQKGIVLQNGIVLKDGVDFIRKVTVQNPSKKMLFLSAIANPTRLEEFLQDYAQNIVAKITLKDHALFDKNQVKKWLDSTNATSILTTQKDAVKLESFGFPLSIMTLDLEVCKEALEPIINYLRHYQTKQSKSTR